MSNTKKTMKWFDLMDYDKEAQYLRKMHQDGWKFVKARGLGVYTFEACEPEDMVYQLDYSPEGLDNKEEYIQMFTDCGWEYVFEFFGYTYFRKPATECDGEESIFSDIESREEMLRTIFLRRMVPMLILYAYMMFLYFVPAGRHHALYEISLVVIIFYTVIFLNFARKYFRFRKEIGK